MLTFDVPRFSASWLRFRRIAPKLLAAVAATLVIGSLLVHTGTRPAAAAPPLPVVGLDLDTTPFIGEQVPIDLTFSNPTPADTGYGPFTDLFLPTNGADGTSGGGPRDGVSFTSATYLGATVPSTVTVLACDGSDVHPLTGQPVTCPAGFTAGDTMTTLTLPFGSFTPTQPAATLSVLTQLSNFADLGHTLPIVARGGFRFGADPLANPLTDPPIFGANVSSSVTPSLITIAKQDNGPESETATGPNFGRLWNVAVDLAPGQTVTNLRVTDALPDDIAYSGISSITPSGTVTDQPAGPGPWAAESVTVTYPSATTHAAYDVGFWVPELDAAGNPVIDPTGGAATTVSNDASAVGNWTPLDPRDPAGTDNAVADPAGPLDTITARSVATQKSVVVATDTGPAGPTPGDTLTWTIQVQVSDYFDFEDLALDDIAADGQTLDVGFSPTISYRTPDGSGSAALGSSFDASVNSPGSPGGCAPTDAGATTIGIDLAGFLAGAHPASGGVWRGDAAGGTVATITYQTVIDASYRCRFGGGAVNSRDVIDNVATVSGRVDVPGGAVVTDGTDDSVTIVAPSTAKSVYAINGDTSDTGPDIAAGDRVTYRITATAPITNVLGLTITDYLPLPTFDIPSGATPFTNLTGSGPVAPGPFSPIAWSVALGPTDTFSAATSSTPTLSVDQTGNSVAMSYPDYQSAPGTTGRTIDLLITVVANDQPFADGLLLTNQARLSSANSPDEVVNQDVIVQVNLTQPVLEITKGVVATDNPAGTFSPAQVGPAGISWSAPGSAGTRFSGGSLTSTALATAPVDSNLSRVDAGDTVTFAVVVTNTGSGIRGAFDVAMADVVPAGFSMPAGGWNLAVTDGNGTALAHTGTMPASITLTDPAADRGALTEYDASSGTNLAVVTFDATLDATVAMTQVLTNQAQVTNFSGSESGPNFVLQPIEDTATVTTAPPTFNKSVIATGIGVTPTAPPNLELPIGSTAVYRVVASVPEGQTANFSIRDTLDAGLAFVSFDSITPSAGLSTSHSGGFAGSLADVAVTGSGTVATFPLDTITNSNTDNSTPETITIEYTVVLLNAASNTTGGSRNNSVTGRVGSSNVGSAASAPNIRINEPSLTVTKSASPNAADAGDTITYTVTMAASAATRTITAHDVVLTDTLPSGVDYVAGSFTHTAGVAPSSIDTSAASATWTTFAPGASSTFTLQAVVRDDATSFGPSVINTARATYTSLPGTHSSSLSPYSPLGVERTGSTADPGGAANTYNRTGTSTVAVNSSTVTKSLVSTSASHTSGSSVTIGETATFRLDVTVPDGNLGDVTVTDVMPAGLTYVAGSAAIIPGSFAGTWTGSPALPAAQMSGNNVNFVFPNMSVTSGPGTSDNTFAITLTARVADVPGNAAGTTLPNVGRVTVAGTQFNSVPVNLTVVVPALSVTKTFTPGQAAANDSVTVGLTVTNTGTSTAYDTVVSDVFDGDVFTSVTPNAVAGWTATAVPQGDDTLVTYTANSGTALAVSGAQSFSVTATLVGDVTAPATHTNTANASGTTLDGPDVNERTVTASGSDTLDVTGVDIAVTKTADVATADAGEDITYTLTVENLGDRDATGVTLSDTLGSHVALLSASGSHSVTGNTINWTPFPLAAHATTTRTVTVRVVNPLPVGASSTTNTATAADDHAHGADTDPSNNSDSALVGLGSVVDLSVDKTGPATVVPGGSISYGVTVTNLGDRNADDATVTDTLGTGLTFVSATGGGTYDPGTRTVTWTGVDLTGTAGSTPSASFTVNATVPDPVPAGRLNVTNGAEVSHPDDVNPLNDSDSVVTAVDADVDLAVTKTDGVTEVVPGDALTYTVSVTNSGSRGAAGVTVVDTLDANHTFVSASNGGTYDPGTRTVTWTLGVVEVGDVVTRTVDVTVSDPLSPLSTSSLTNTAVVSDDGTNGPERDPSDNTATDVDLTGADLAVTKELDSPAVVPGDRAVYSIAVTNHGPMTVADVSVNDTMPTTFSLISASVDVGSIDTATWLWTGVDLAPGDTATLTVTVEVSLDATGDQTNAVTVTGIDVGDPDPSNNSDSVTDPADPTADLSLSKTLEGSLARGATASWLLVVTNHGPSRATAVTVTDTLPSGLTYSGATGVDGANWTCTTTASGTVSCVLDGTMQPGDTAGLRISTTVAADAPAGTVQNRATASAAETETTAANNSAVAAGSLAALPSPVQPSDVASPGGGAAQPSSLPFTGTNPATLLGLGASLIAAGAALVVIRRRRER
ncbi:MAG: DUF11 domain-containing protein [Microthrixaceae bacterium]|nr:DUF11 domain-containing protein [Microthrixaceae bacterium]